MSWSSQWCWCWCWCWWLPISWKSQLKTPMNNTIYLISFNYSPIFNRFLHSWISWYKIVVLKEWHPDTASYQFVFRHNLDAQVFSINIFLWIAIFQWDLLDGLTLTNSSMGVVLWAQYNWCSCWCWCWWWWWWWWWLFLIAFSMDQPKSRIFIVINHELITIESPIHMSKHIIKHKFMFVSWAILKIKSIIINWHCLSMEQ